MSGIVDNDQQQAIRRQKERQRWATERFKPWGEPQPDDYDFGRWAKGASKALLEADCFYEYACESRRLRCLFVLISAARKRRDFEPCSFDGLLEEDARRTLGGALHCLTGFADQLADNKSFAELLRTRHRRLCCCCRLYCCDVSRQKTPLLHFYVNKEPLVTSKFETSL